MISLTWDYTIIDKKQLQSYVLYTLMLHLSLKKSVEQTTDDFTRLLFQSTKSSLTLYSKQAPVEWEETWKMVNLTEDPMKE